jgi:hypothetical protein
MPQRTAPEFVTAMLVCACTAALAVGSAIALPSQAEAALFKVSLMEKSKVLSTRTIDTEKPGPTSATAHTGQGLSFEVQDKLASCDVFLEPSRGSKNHDKAEVRVSLIENASAPVDGKIPHRIVFSNSAMLTKQKIAPKDQTVYAGAAGARQVTVDAPKLNRTCTVSVL